MIRDVNASQKFPSFKARTCGCKATRRRLQPLTTFASDPLTVAAGYTDAIGRDLGIVGESRPATEEPPVLKFTVSPDGVKLTFKN